MTSLLVKIFLLQITIHVINTVGAPAINALAWSLYNYLPVPTSKANKEQQRLQKEFWRLKKELSATSAQDEFAKWAKLDREYNKVVAQLEKTKAILSSSKATFDTYISSLRWIGTNGLRFFLQWWYTKEPMFWLPEGWVPYYAEWLLSFPRAPLGSISIQAWFVACGAVILLASDAILATIKLLTETTTRQPQKSKETPMKFATEKATARVKSPEGKDGMKEL